MNQSLASKASNASSQMLEELANRSQSKIYRIQGSFNDEEMRIIWNALGLYISRNLRMGRGVNIPKLGIFTFTPPQVNLKGVTNQLERDQRPRMPVFLIQKQFIKGVPLKSAIFYHQQFGLGLRPYTALGATGDIPITKMNLLQISSYANMTKDATELGLNRIIKYVAQKILSGQNISIEIPNVGMMISRNNLVAVKFNEFLQRDTRTILSKSVDQRIKKGQMKLTADNLKKFGYLSEMSQKLGNKSDEFLNIDENTRNYLKTTFGFHFDPTNLNRSTTNFDRTVATRQFDMRNRSLKTSHISRISQSGFITNKVKFFNRQYNLALKLVKEWISQNSKNSQSAFKDFCKISGKKSSQALNPDDVWAACKQISSDITQQQAHQLFRVLDSNKDGFVTKDDWIANISFNTNQLVADLVKFIRQKGYKISDVLKTMGLEGISKINVYNLKESLKKLNTNLKEQQAFYLSRYIAKGNNQVEIQNILEVLHVNDNNEKHVSVDCQWEDKFLSRLKRKMIDHQIYEEQLENKMRFYDKNSTGFIQQTDFKNVLAELGISLTLSELIKIVKIFPINQKNNNICYHTIIDRLRGIDATTHTPINEQQFIKIIQTKLFNKNPFPIQLPISVRKLTSQLQSTLFKQEQQVYLQNLVKKIDVNGNGDVSSQDIAAYKQIIRKRGNPTGILTSKVDLDQLIIKIRQKSIKKKISFFELFKKLDSNKDGFITFQQWKNNINQIISLNNQQIQDLFDYIDREKIRMIDYKIFLAIMNGNNADPLAEKFDWVQQTINKIKQWFSKSQLSIEQAFRVVDSDGDTYLSQKDFNSFLIDKIKYQQREISHVRLQKLMKIFDGYKRGKIDFIDWCKILQTNQINWIKDAQQQIGIVLSRIYQNLSEGFTNITQGQNKLVFNQFQKWIKQYKVLHGFMTNQQMLKHLFSQCDSHKKGYLLEKDFIGLFGKYNWKSEQIRQFIQILQSKFKTCLDVFNCMSSYKSNDKINYQKFQQFTREVFGDRFKKSDIKDIWKKIVGNKDILTSQLFVGMFGQEKGWNNQKNQIDVEYPKDDWIYQDYNIIKGTQIRSNEHKYHQAQDMEVQCRKIVNNIKQILLTSPKSLQQVFLEVDQENKGAVTNLQFKKAFRNLNIAITSKEIDLLLNYCDFKLETLINWRQFIRRFNLQQDKIRIINRIASKMQHLSDLLHYYMISPKDAYRKWNNPRTGYMSFQEFHLMLKNLYDQASQSIPEYAILKEFFDYIDIRKDSQLDFQEFTQTFRNFNPPSLLMGTTPIQVTNKPQSTKKKQSTEKQGLPIRQHKVPLFKHSTQYQELVKLIGRNRRYLQEAIQQKNPQKVTLVSFSIVQKILKEFAKQLGVIVDTELIRNVIAFSMTGDNVDYRLLFENYKEMNQSIVEFPKKKLF